VPVSAGVDAHITRRRFLMGLAPAGLAALRPASAGTSPVPVVRDAVAAGEIPGAVVHVRERGRVVYEEAVGLKSVEDRLSLSAGDIFPVASLTKPVVAAAILQLAEAGKLRVDDPVERYLPEFARPRVLLRYDAATGAMTTRPARRLMTLRHLLTHTAGVHHGHVEIDPVLGGIYAKAGVVHDSRLVLAEKMRRLGPLPLAHDPGAKWTYGLSSDVLGRVVEVVGGVALDQYVTRAILEPLEMRRTYFVVPEAERSHVVARYSRGDAGLRRMPSDPHASEARYVSGGGGLLTTVSDYARFAQALLDGGGPILSRASVRAMTRNQLGTLSAFGFRWGFSLAVSTPNARGQSPLPVGGFGWYGIFGTWFWAMPREQRVVLMFANVLRQDMTLPLFSRVVEDAGRAA
jgi:CubicO group peptidase (beta-lactamase class C family)